jgi:hypothetical protein
VCALHSAGAVARTGGLRSRSSRRVLPFAHCRPMTCSFPQAPISLSAGPIGTQKACAARQRRLSAAPPASFRWSCRSRSGARGRRPPLCLRPTTVSKPKQPQVVSFDAVNLTRWSFCFRRQTDLGRWASSFTEDDHSRRLAGCCLVPLPVQRIAAGTATQARY